MGREAVEVRVDVAENHANARRSAGGNTYCYSLNTNQPSRIARDEDGAVGGPGLARGTRMARWADPGSQTPDDTNGY